MLSPLFLFRLTRATRYLHTEAMNLCFCALKSKDIFHRSMNFFSLKRSRLDSRRGGGCSPEKGGVGIELNVHNVILELRAGSAAEKGGGLRSGDRVVAIDGEQLNYRQLAEGVPASPDCMRARWRAA